MIRNYSFTIAGTSKKVNGSDRTRGDTTPIYSLVIYGTGLDDASLKMTLKSDIAIDDTGAEVAKSSATGGGIVISEASTDTKLMAQISFAKSDTEGVYFPPSTPNSPFPKLKLWYDVQLVKANGEVTTIEGTKDSAHIWLLPDVTQTNS